MVSNNNLIGKPSPNSLYSKPIASSHFLGKEAHAAHTMHENLQLVSMIAIQTVRFKSVQGVLWTANQQYMATLVQRSFILLRGAHKLLHLHVSQSQSQFLDIATHYSKDT